MKESIRGVLFDLDGTLADTAPDLGFALNQLLLRRGRAALPLSTIRPRVSHGARGMLAVGFGLLPDDPEFAALRDEFLQVYESNLCRETQLFAGMTELLLELERAKLPWGIVTNKAKRFTEPLIDALQLSARAGCIISGDSAARAKPHPDTLILGSQQLGIAREQIVYVGDDERDVIAARAAGMRAVVALYGYLGVDRHPDHWGADAQIEHPLALMPLLT